MKTLLILLLISVYIMHAQAQKIKANDVPVQVTDAFKKAYPKGIIDKVWEKKGKYYEVGFNIDKTDYLNTYSASGKLIKSAVQIPVADLSPRIVAYVDSCYPKMEIREAFKIINAKGVIS